MSSQFTLQIDDITTSPGWQSQWFRDGQPITQPIEVPAHAAKSMADMSRRLLVLFEHDDRPLIDQEDLTAIGRVMFETWFEPARTALTGLGNGQAPRNLIIESAEHRVLNLPWELVELTPDLPVGCYAEWCLYRSPLRTQTSVGGRLQPGPLRILFLAAAPIDLPQLDYEREEEAMLRATARLPGVTVLFAEMGSFEELVDSAPGTLCEPTDGVRSARRRDQGAARRVRWPETRATAARTLAA